MSRSGYWDGTEPILLEVNRMDIIVPHAAGLDVHKSVSLLWGLSDQRVSARVREAHDAAVAAAVGYLEEHAGWSRRGAGGRRAVAGRGFVAAAFRHRASRDRDPLLHTHVLVANVIQADDGTWGTLDATRLYRHAKTEAPWV